MWLGFCKEKDKLTSSKLQKSKNGMKFKKWLKFCKEDNEHDNKLALRREKWQGDDLVEGDKIFTRTIDHLHNQHLHNKKHIDQDRKNLSLVQGWEHQT
jgi:hypothetical protein